MDLGVGCPDRKLDGRFGLMWVNHRYFFLLPRLNSLISTSWLTPMVDSLWTWKFFGMGWRSCGKQRGELGVYGTGIRTPLELWEGHPPLHPFSWEQELRYVTIAKIWNQCKCPLVNEWIKKMQCVYTMKYLGMREKEILPFATTWMDLKDIMLSKINQREKDKYCMISLVYGI